MAIWWFCYRRAEDLHDLYGCAGRGWHWPCWIYNWASLRRPRHTGPFERTNVWADVDGLRVEATIVRGMKALILWDEATLTYGYGCSLEVAQADFRAAYDEQRRSLEASVNTLGPHLERVLKVMRAREGLGVMPIKDPDDATVHGNYG